MDGQRFDLRRSMLAAGAAALVCSTGCVQFLSHLGYWAGGSMIPAAYDGLEGQRVAVVCVSDSTSYGAGSEAEALARMVSAMLAENVEKIEVVPAAEIADWDDKHDWDQIDYRDVGRGVKADRVVAINLSGFSLHQGQSLYKGRADVTVSVLDMARDGREVFRRTESNINYPANGFYHTSETPENTFRGVFLRVIARRVARHFFEFDALNEFGLDPANPAG